MVEITYPLPNFNVALLKFESGQFISSSNLQGIKSFIHAEIKVKPW